MTVPPWAVLSPMRTHIRPPTVTVVDPFKVISGTQQHMIGFPGAGATGRPQVRIVGTPGARIGPPTWGQGPGATI